MRDNRDTSRDHAPQGEREGRPQESEPQADGVSSAPGDTAPLTAENGATEAVQGGSQRRTGGGPSTSQAAQQDPAALLDEQRDKYLRLAAEFDNYRKRTTRERQEAGVRAQGELLKRILDSLDDLDRATSASMEGVDAESIVEGVRAVDQKLMRTLADAGLQVLIPLHEPFNPELHEAIATEPALSPEDDHLVAQVFQPGYIFQGQLLRPSRVVVKQWSK